MAGLTAGPCMHATPYADLRWIAKSFESTWASLSAQKSTR